MAANPQEVQRGELAALVIALGVTRSQLLRSGVQFLWDADRGRYWSLASQTIISSGTVRDWVDTAIATSENRITFLTRRLINRSLDFPAWYTQTQAELKAMHVALSTIAIGGPNQWSSTPAGRLGARLRMLYDKLNGLGLEWEQGLVSPAQMLARMHMAVQAGRGTYEGMFRGLMLDNGMNEEMRVLGASAHCADCPPISGRWVTIGTLPGIGDTACLCITTPESRVLTANGLVAISKVRVGEMVMTHLGRFRPVTATPIRFAADKYQAFVRGESWLGCTSDHKWLTPAGWQTIGDIANNKLLVYNWRHAKALSELRLRNCHTEPSGAVSSLPEAMRMRRGEGSSGEGMRELFYQANGFTAMARSDKRGTNTRRTQDEGAGTATAMGGPNAGIVLSDQDGRSAAIRYLLGRRHGTVADNLSLSVGVDSGKWSDPSRSRDTSPESRLRRRPTGEPETVTWRTACPTSRTGESSRTSGLDMSTMWHGFQGIPALPSSHPEILFTGLLPRTTPLYDLTVEEDHSFIIEGLVAHNSNCTCTFDYRRGPSTPLVFG